MDMELYLDDSKPKKVHLMLTHPTWRKTKQEFIQMEESSFMRINRETYLILRSRLSSVTKSC